MVFNQFSRALTTPIWLLVLVSMVPWYISFLAQYSDMLARYWYALGNRFAPWEWVALVCAMWAMLVLALISSVAKYQKLWHILGVVLFGFFAQKAYIEGLDNDGTRKLLGMVCIAIYYFAGYYLIHLMYSIEYKILRYRRLGKNTFPTLKINIHHDFTYRIAEKNIFLLMFINMAWLGLYYMDFSQLGWRTASCVVIGVLGVVILGLQRLKLIQAWQLTINREMGWFRLDEAGMHWCFDVIEWSSFYRLGTKYPPVCHHHENFIAWQDVETIGFLETPKHPKQKKVLDYPELILICSRVLPPSDHQVQVLLPYIRNEYFFMSCWKFAKRPRPWVRHIALSKPRNGMLKL